MSFGDLVAALRGATPAPARRVGERLAEAGKVALRNRDEDEWTLQVVAGGQAFDVELWPEDAEWECSCEAEGCAHAWGALQAAQAGSFGEAREVPTLAVGLHRDDRWLKLSLLIRTGDSLKTAAGIPAGVELGETLARLLRHLRDVPGDRIPGRLNKFLLGALLEQDEVLLDGEPIGVSKVGLDVVGRVDPLGAGFRLTLADPDGVDAAFDGDPVLLLSDGVLRPRGYARLSTLQRNQLAAPMIFSSHELPRLTSEWMPALSKAGVQVVRSEAVPESRPAGLHAALHAVPRAGSLELLARVVYGDPPVAELVDGQLIPLGGVTALPPRDRRREAELVGRFERELGMRPGRRLMLRPEQAARLLRDRLPRFSGDIIGRESLEAYRIQADVLQPQPRWGSDGLHLNFGGGGAVVGADRVLAAFEAGEDLVALQGGGFAPLPTDWLAEHIDHAKLATGAGGMHTAVLAAELFEATDRPPPPDLTGLVAVLRDEDGVPDRDPPPGLRAELRTYQRRGQSWLRALVEQGLGAVLADDMGLGKTLQALAVLLDRKDAGPALVVAPTSVLANWEREASKFTPSLRVVRLHGSRRTAGYAALKRGEVDVAITSYALLRLDADRLDRRWSTAVLDEAQAIKNPESQTAKAAHAIQADAKIALTGTPIENRLSELWSLMEFINPGFFGPRSAFEQRLGRPAAAGDPQAVAALRGRVRPFFLRRLKAEVAPDLPPRTVTVLSVPLLPEQQVAYNKIKRAGRTELGAGPQRRMRVLALLTRLRQAACDASLLPDEEDVPSGKLDALLERLEELAEEGHRTLVFSQWTSLLDRVEPRLEAAGLTWLRLDGSTRDRQALVDEFQSADGPPVFLISLKAGGTGLNLTAADHVFHLDPWWNPAAEQQATDRAHRIGQDKPVFVWKLVSEGSVEERVLALQERKRALADAVLSDADGAAALGVDELEALLQD